MAKNDGIFPVPLGAIPINVSLFVQEKMVVPELLLVVKITGAV
jgi:hypothetical protein